MTTSDTTVGQAPHNGVGRSPPFFDAACVNPAYTWKHPAGEKVNYEYNRLVEEQVSTVLFQDHGCSINPAPDGFFPGWDYEISVRDFKRRIEQKLKQSQRTQEYKFMDIELRYPDGRPSALQLTTSDYYLILTVEYNSKVGRVVKCRLVYTALLKYMARESIAAGHLSFALDPHNMPHVWVGDFAVNDDGTWDLRSLVRQEENLLIKMMNYEREAKQLLTQIEN